MPGTGLYGCYLRYKWPGRVEVSTIVVEVLVWEEARMGHSGTSAIQT